LQIIFGPSAPVIWKLNGMYGLAQIYDEARYDLSDLLRLHKIVMYLGMNERDIYNVLELVKHNQLLQDI
jgi:hypothetical protein